jgi:hypothetical protein
MKRHIEAFLDEQGNNRVLINGKVQPLRYSPFAVIDNKPQTLYFERWKYVCIT